MIKFQKRLKTPQWHIQFHFSSHHRACQRFSQRTPPALFVIEKAATTPSLAKKEGIGLHDPTAGMRRWDVSDPEERLLENYKHCYSLFDTI
jgi:hypothetical protein